MAFFQKGQERIWESSLEDFLLSIGYGIFFVLFRSGSYFFQKVFLTFMKKYEFYFLLGTLYLMTSPGCQKRDGGPPPSPIARINSIIFRQADNHFLYGTDTTGHFLDSLHIQFTLPGGSDLTHLIPTINFTGADIIPASGTAQDFSNPVNYFVTAPNGSKRGYQVSVRQTYANSVFVGSNDGNIYNFDATTGNERWHFKTNDSVQSSPIIIEDFNSLYMGGLDHNLYALNLISGAKIWATPTNGPITASVTYPAEYNEGVLYLGSWDGNLYAINGYNGSIMWQMQVGGIISGSSLLQEPIDYLYVGTRSGELYNFFIDYASDIIDSLSLGGPISGSLAMSDIYASFMPTSIFYYTTGDLNVYARSYYFQYAPNNEPFWTYATGGAVVSSPIVANGYVYVGSTDSKIYALNDTTGALLWAYPTGGPVKSRATVAAGLVYAGSDDGKLYAINALTGALAWSAQTGNAIQGACVVANGVVYVGSTDNHVYAYVASSGALLWAGNTSGSIVGSPAVIGKDSTTYY